MPDQLRIHSSQGNITTMCIAYIQHLHTPTQAQESYSHMHTHTRTSAQARETHAHRLVHNRDTRKHTLGHKHMHTHSRTQNTDTHTHTHTLICKHTQVYIQNFTCRFAHAKSDSPAARVTRASKHLNCSKILDDQ